MSDPAVVEAPPGARVLVAEDEKHLAVLLEHFLAGRGHQVQVVHDGRAALDAITGGAHDVALLDVQMPGLDGLSVLRAAQALPLPPQIVVMTGNGTIDTALAALQAGAYDYVAKPYRMAEVDLLVRRAAERRRLEVGRVALTAAAEPAALVARDAVMLDAVDAVRRAAPTLGALLLVGEPGAGRATLARLAHEEAGGGTFVELDAASPDAAYEPEVARRLAAARGGTLFVRRVDLLPASAQQLIEAAMRGEPPVRVVASSARTPEARTPEARTPEALSLDASLAASLKALVVRVPPLRERPGDVPALATTFARQFGGASAPTLAEAALAALATRPWPGNVAELRLVIEGAVARATGGIVSLEHLA